VRRAFWPRWRVREANSTAQSGISNGLGTDSVNQRWRRQALAEFSGSAWAFCDVHGGCPCVSHVVTRPDSTDNVEAVARPFTTKAAPMSSTDQGGGKRRCVTAAGTAPARGAVPQSNHRVVGAQRAREPKHCRGSLLHEESNNNNGDFIGILKVEWGHFP
jgi:hypothetical protein